MSASGGAPRDAELDRLQRRLVANAGKLFSSTTLASLFGLASFVVVTRSLGPAEFGALVLVYTYGTALTRLTGFQTWEMIIRFAAQHAAQDARDRVAGVFRFGWCLDLAACVAAAALTWLLADVFAAVFDWRAQVENGARWYALAVLFSLTGAPTAALRYFNRFDLVAWHRVSAAVLRLGIMLVVAWIEPSFNGFLAGWIAAQIAGQLILIVLGGLTQAGNGVRMRRAAPIRQVATADVLRFLGASKLNGVLRVVRELDAQVVALMIDEAAAGLLRVARQLAAIVVRFVDAFFEAIYPELADLAAQGRWQLLRAFVRRASLQVGSATLVPLAGFALLGSWFLEMVFGAAFVPAFATVCALLGGLVFWGFGQPFAPSLMAMNRAGRLFLVNLVATAAYAVLLLTLVPVYAQLGAGLALAGLHLVWALAGVAAYAVTLRQQV